MEMMSAMSVVRVLNMTVELWSGGDDDGGVVEMMTAMMTVDMTTAKLDDGGDGDAYFFFIGDDDVSLNKKSFRVVSSTSGRQSVVDRLEAVWVSSSFEAKLGFLLVLKLGFSVGSNLVDVALQDPCEFYIVLLLFTYLRILVSSFVVLERLMLFMVNVKSRLKCPTAFLIFK
ncbi:hypothetical protein Tco_1312109 [Tanacetum coccineum]